MIASRRRLGRALVLGFAVATLGLSACGAADEPAAAAETTSTTVLPETDDLDEGEGEGEDHDDEGEDHDDEGDDHDDEADEHDDEGEGEDHDDEGEDHKDEGEDHKDEHDDEGSSGLGAHEHGGAELSVAWFGAEVSIDLISPTFNVFGFEYEPTTDEDIAIEKERTEALTAPGLITFDDNAGCNLADPAETETERDGSHSEVTVTWRFVCDNPDELSNVDLSDLFAQFPNFEDIDAQWVSDADQSSAELSPTDPSLGLRN